MKNTTLWWVLGGLAVVGGGTAIYLATRKPEEEEKKLPGGGGGGGGTLNPSSVAPFFMPQASLVDQGGGGIDENTKWVDAKGNPFTPPAWWQPRFGPPCPGCRPA